MGSKTGEEILIVHKGGNVAGSTRALSPEAHEKMSRLMKERQEKVQRLRKAAEMNRRMETLKAELLWRKKNWAITYYAVKPDGSTSSPNPPQTKFHSLPNKIRVFSAGNRSGKTTGGVNEDVSYSLGYRPWIPEGGPGRKVDVAVPNVGLIMSESFQEQVKKVLVPKLLGDPDLGVAGAIPSDEVLETRKNPLGVVTSIKLKNGSQIYLQSYDQEFDLYESAKYHWAHFDEPPPRGIWVAVQRGLADTEGPCWITMTPIKEAWIYDEIYQRSDVGLVYGDIEDNVGFGLTKAGIDQFALSLTDDEKEARLRGRYFHLTGLVYKSYGAVHRVKRARVFPDFSCPAHWSMYMHIDTHSRNPHHAVYVAVAPDARMYVCGELKNGDPGNKIEPFCEALKVYEHKMFQRGIGDFTRLMDPIAATPNPVGEGITVWDEFARCMGPDWSCKPGSKNRDAGILLAQAGFAHDPEKGVYPSLYVMDDLPGVHYELTHYVWDEWIGKATQSHMPKQVPVKKADHFIEGIHRILLEGPVCEEETQEDETPRPNEAAAHVSITGY